MEPLTKLLPALASRPWPAVFAIVIFMLLGPLKKLLGMLAPAGPAAAMHLADFGAEVIKVERPGSGDDPRRFVPAFKGECSAFMKINRSKHGITIDLKSEQGQG